MNNINNDARNTGTKKGHSDVKRVTHYFYYLNGEKTEITKEVEKLYKEHSKLYAGTLTKTLFIFKPNISSAFLKASFIAKVALS